MKRTIQTYTFLLTLLALLQACNDPSPLGRMGGAIDSLIEQRPDSVLHLLQDIDYNALDEEGQAHYGLLFTAARYKLYQPVDTTFINRSIAYYSASHKGIQSSPFLRDKRGALGASLYYKAVVLYELGKKEEATLLLKQAEELAEQGGDELLQNKIYERLFVVNEQSGNFQTAIKYGKLFLKSSEATQDAESICRAYDKLSSVYSKQGKRDSMDMMQKKCLDFVNFVSNESKAYILSNLADSRIANEQIDEAESLLYVSARFKELPNTYIMLGKICYRKGYEDEAIRYWKKTTSMGNDRFAVKAYRLLSESENKHRRYKNALVLLAKADSIEHNLILSNNTETIANVEYGYEHSVLNKQKHAVVQLVKIVVLLLLISLIIYIVHIILLRKKILKKTEKLRESAAQISVCKKRISFLEKEDQTIANLLEQNKLEIAKIQESLQEAKRRTEEKCKMVEKLEQEKFQYEENMFKNKKEKAELQDTIKRLYENDYHHFVLGKSIFERVMSTKSYPHMTKSKEQALVDYYTISHYERFSEIIIQYESLSLGSLCYLVLKDMGLSHTEMQAVLNVKESSIRMRLKRANEKRKNT